MWNPEQYLKFAQPRFRPAQDLLARIMVDSPKVVYDLGCGTGNVTRMLAERWSKAKVIGVDDSAEMLAQAGKTSSRIEWRQQSIADWHPKELADVIFSNAALQWLPNHETLFPNLMKELAPGGILAVQIPRNFGEPSHMLIWETLQAGPWAARLQHMIRPAPVELPEFYYRLLAPVAAEVDIWETKYQHVLQGKDPVKEWTKGTWLRRFLDELDESERPAFEEDYAKRLREAYKPQSDGNTLFPFRRLFMVVKGK